MLFDSIIYSYRICSLSLSYIVNGGGFMRVAEILIVDDQPDQIRFAGDILKSVGYHVYVATSGKKALKFLQTRKPDLIVLDIKMEDIDGITVCREIKKKTDTKDIPVIFLTTEKSHEVIRKGFEAGCSDYICKPYIREEYLARIQVHLKIHQQNKMLINANEELNMFCSAVSHDLRSPLQVMGMLLESLKDEIVNDNKEEVIKISDLISMKANELDTMIKRLLEFSRMCNVKMNKQQLNLDEIFDTEFEELQKIETDRNINFFHGELGSIFGDEVLIRMVVKNILSNALKYTRKRHTAVITVSMEYDAPFKRISVTDNGVGFDEEYADKLFNVFQRLHDSSEFEGSGVGLAIVKKVMLRHGGAVAIKGSNDNGVTITLTFNDEC